MVTVLRETGRVYELGQLLAPVPELPLLRRAVETTPPAWGVPTDGPPVRLSERAQQVWAGATAKHTSDGRVDRSASLVQIARVLYDAGASRPQMVAALAERDVALGWEKYTSRRDAEEQYQRTVDVVERGAPTRRRARDDQHGGYSPARRGRNRSAPQYEGMVERLPWGQRGGTTAA